MRIIFASLAILLLAYTSFGQSPKEVEDIVKRKLAIEKEIQNERDIWAKKKQELILQYEKLKEQEKELKNLKNMKKMEMEAQERRVKELKREIKEAKNIKGKIDSYLIEVTKRISKSVYNSLPFLLDERKKRLKRLYEILFDKDERASKKYRMVMETLKVEAEYGETVEVYEDEIEVEGKKMFASILRVGRISLFFATPDRKKIGWFLPAFGMWHYLPSKYKKSITLAFEMANKQRPVEFIKLPLGKLEKR